MVNLRFFWKKLDIWTNSDYIMGKGGVPVSTEMGMLLLHVGVKAP